ncbi:MAG: SDR family oxidoreductase [Acidimicrobiia bacterium]|jgi:NAD(P)-dependent dehydrogenase (short-subunit alcohol dehydrogenase family)
MSGLDGKVALVTGAGQGIGRGIALALAKQGAAVSIVGRTLSKLEKTVATIEERGATAIAVEADVKDAADVDRAVSETVARLGSLDVLVNNAQEYNFGPLLDIPFELVDAGWQSGPVGTLRFMRAAHEHLKNGGVVINMSSSAANDTDLAGIGAYSATKAAIDSLSRAAAVEWAGDGIRVNTLMPFARTPSVEASFEMVPGLEEQLIAGIPLQRIGDPETDIGPVATFLAGDDSRFITGTTISVDGGAVRLR